MGRSFNDEMMEQNARARAEADRRAARAVPVPAPPLSPAPASPRVPPESQAPPQSQAPAATAPSVTGHPDRAPGPAVATPPATRASSPAGAAPSRPAGPATGLSPTARRVRAAVVVVVALMFLGPVFGSVLGSIFMPFGGGSSEGVEPVIEDVVSDAVEVEAGDFVLALPPEWAIDVSDPAAPVAYAPSGDLVEILMLEPWDGTSDLDSEVLGRVGMLALERLAPNESNPDGTARTVPNAPDNLVLVTPQGEVAAFIGSDGAAWGAVYHADSGAVDPGWDTVLASLRPVD